MRLPRALTALIALWAAPAYAVDCGTQIFEGNRFTLCTVDAQAERIKLFLKDDSGKVLGHFSEVDRHIGPNHQLSFAMNAGMYHPDRRPVGYYVENFQPAQKLFTKASPGNFGLLPNGVFCIREGRADVIETLAFQRMSPECRFATQSGPMLVIDGALHPRFLPDSTSKFVRNGVGTSADGTRAVFVKSENRVSFHEFGRFFRDALKIPQALYFDGKVSRIHAPAIGRSDPGFWLGPIVGVVESTKDN